MTETTILRKPPPGYFERPMTYNVRQCTDSRGGWILEQYRGYQLVYGVWLGIHHMMELERKITEERGFKKREGSL